MCAYIVRKHTRYLPLFVLRGFSIARCRSCSLCAWKDDDLEQTGTLGQGDVRSAAAGLWFCAILLSRGMTSGTCMGHSCTFYACSIVFLSLGRTWLCDELPREIGSSDMIRISAVASLAGGLPPSFWVHKCGFPLAWCLTSVPLNLPGSIAERSRSCLYCGREYCQVVVFHREYCVLCTV